MKLTFAIMFVFCTTLFAEDVFIEVTNVQSSKGEIQLAMYDSSDGFPSEHNQARMNLRMEPTNPKLKIDLKPGEYAFAIFHDENSDETLNTNMVGIPTESFGFSNNPKIYFGPPSFKKASFKVEPNKQKKVSIKLKSFL